jgi:hypothetical protein
VSTAKSRQIINVMDALSGKLTREQQFGVRLIMVANELAELLAESARIADAHPDVPKWETVTTWLAREGLQVALTRDAVVEMATGTPFGLYAKAAKKAIKRKPRKK